MNKQILALSISTESPHDQNILSILDRIPNINLKLFTTQYNILIPNKNFSIFPIYEAKYSYGALVVWDLLSLELGLDFPNISSIIYLQDGNIPWSSNTTIPYVSWAKFFDNPKVKIVTDNPTIAEIFTLTWKTPILLSNTDPESLYEIL